jgi:hypothetical protein
MILTLHNPTQNVPQDQDGLGLLPPYYRGNDALQYRQDVAWGVSTHHQLPQADGSRSVPRMSCAG